MIGSISDGNFAAWELVVIVLHDDPTTERHILTRAAVNVHAHVDIIAVVFMILAVLLFGGRGQGQF